MQRKLTEIAKLINGEIIGQEDFVIKGISGIKEAREGDLTFVANSKYFHLIDKTKASAIIAPRDIKETDKTVILTDNPSVAFAEAVALFLDEEAYHIKGIHDTAIISKEAKIGKNVNVGPYVVISDKATIGDNTVIHSGSYVGHNTSIGNDCLIYPNVTVRERITIGSHVIIHSGTVIGSDGFGFVKVEEIHQKIPQTGTVVIEDDVEIGANVAVDRARFDKTFIGKGTKVDNLVQIAHNVTIGEKCLIIAQVGIAGSNIIESGAVLAGQAGVAGHLTIGEGAIVAAQAGVTKSVPPNTMVSGYPAKPHAHAKKVNACLQKLPEHVNAINDLKNRIEKLENELEKFKK